MNFSRVKIKNLFTVIFSLTLLMRIYTTVAGYTLPVDISLIEVTYVLLLIIIHFSQRQGFSFVFDLQNLNFLAVIFVVHLVLFCYIFINPEMSNYTGAIRLRQGLFLLNIISTSIFVKKYMLFNEFLKGIFYTFSFVLISQFVLNISEVAYINIFTIFNISQRSRVNFGLSHYNILGAICVVVIITGLLAVTKKIVNKTEARLIKFIIFISFLMLLGSASRNAIIGLIVYFLLQIYINLSKYEWGYKYKFLVKFFIILILLFLLVFGINSSIAERLIHQSNRATLFNVALPTFFESGRTLFGLGLASSEVYGLNKTPYTTYWLDNGYIYTLVTTGFIGLIIFLIAIIFIAKKIVKLSKYTFIKTETISIFVMYLFGAMFESTLFIGGIIQNYFYCTFFLLICSDYFNKEAISD